MSQTLREFVTKWGFEVDDSQLKKIDQSTTKIVKNLRAAANSAVDLGKKLSFRATLPIVAMGAAMIKAASDAEEGAAKFGTVFQDVEKDANKTAKNLAKDFGLSRAAAKELLGDTGDLLSGFGFTGEASLKLSSDVQKLAVDLASFTNFSGGAKGASAALTKALLGERESVKSLGISILEEDVKKEVALLKTKGLTFATERQAKAQATLNIAMRQSKNAIGDFARTQGGFANQTRILGAGINDLAVSFGTILLPPALKIVKILRGWVETLDELNPGVKTTLLVIAGLVAVLGPLLIIGGVLVNSLLAIRTAFILMGNGGLIASLKLLAIPLLIGAAVVALGLIIEDIVGFFQGRDSITGVIVDEFASMFNALEDKFQSFGKIGKAAILIITAPLRILIAGVRGIGGAIGALVGGGGISGVLDAFSGVVGDVAQPLTELFTTENGPSITSSLGFGQRSGVAANQIGSNAANTTSNKTSVEAPITVNVPAGTSPESVGPFIQTGIKEGLGSMLRETNRNVSSAVAN